MGDGNRFSTYLVVCLCPASILTVYHTVTLIIHRTVLHPVFTIHLHLELTSALCFAQYLGAT